MGHRDTTVVEDNPRRLGDRGFGAARDGDSSSSSSDYGSSDSDTECKAEPAKDRYLSAVRPLLEAEPCLPTAAGSWAPLQNLR